MSALAAWLQRSPLIAILRGVRPHEAVGIAEDLIAAGILIVEVPLNSPEPLESIRRLAVACAGKALVGAGTVMRGDEVDAIRIAGGELIVTPHANAPVVKRAKELGLLAVPGFFSPTEAFAMIDAGADGLKLFPAEAASPKVLGALRAVLPRTIPVLPVGGIDAAAIPAWLKAGANGFGIGSALYKPGLDRAAVAAKARVLVDALKPPVT